MDLDPDILLPEPSNQTLTLVFQASVETATVVAQDPEGQALLFVWEVPHAVPFDQTEVEDDSGVTVSTVQIPNDPVLDGGELTCAVFDPAGNSATVTWEMVVP